MIHKDSFRDAGTSYACILETGENLDKEIRNTVSEMPQTLLAFKTRREETQWLDECIIGMLRPKFTWEEYGEELQEECGNFFIIRHMGDDIVLIQNKTGKSYEELSREMDEWFLHWFEWHQKWEPRDVCHKRLVWTWWYGVPLHAWSSRFFESYCYRVGSFVKLDEASKNKKLSGVCKGSGGGFLFQGN